jgi:hypothetical protein
LSDLAALIVEGAFALLLLFLPGKPVVQALNRLDYIGVHVIAYTKIGDISFCLERRSKNLELDPSPWKPDLNAVRAAIRYAMATERLLAHEQVPL